MDTVTRKTISAAGARRLLDGAIQQAERLGKQVSVAVVDNSGYLVAFGRMDGAGLQTITIAINKARSAGMTGFATGTTLPDGTTLDTHLAIAIPLSCGADSFVTVQGGVPLVKDGAHVGAVGVSGASELEDREIADSSAKLL